jgi:hypothetical protein
LVVAVLLLLLLPGPGASEAAWEIECIDCTPWVSN